MFDPPVDFEKLAKMPKGTTSGSYPYSIKAADLMRNFVFATLAMDESLFTEQMGKNGHKQRRLRIPKVPQSGTYVLGSVGGQLQWIATEECT